MSTEYIVTENDYLQLLDWRLKSSDKSLIKQIIFYGGNSIFTLYSLYYAFQGEGFLRVLLLVMATVLWCIGFLKRKSTGQRAKALLTKLKDKRAFEKGYFGVHSLNEDGEVLTLHYGETKQQISTDDVEVVRYQDISILKRGNIVFEILPSSVSLHDFNLKVVN